MSTTRVAAAPEVERELRDRSRIDRLDLELATAIRTAPKLVGDVAWGELAALGTALTAINQAACQLDTECEWERLIAGLDMVEVATAALYRRARGELRRFETEPGCGLTGKPGQCGSCDPCRALGDEQYDARGDR